MGFNVSKLCFSYNGRRVFTDTTLEIPSSKVTAFLGANGSGKTTMQKLLIGLLKPDSGNITYGEKQITEYSVSELSKQIGWVPQTEEPKFPYTVKEYLMLGRAPYLGFFDSPSIDEAEIVDQVLTRLDIKELENREVTKMSGGEKRLVLIARALVQEPRVLMLDEPTNHLDLGNKSSILQLVEGLKQTGDTVIFSTHDPNEALRVADHVVLFCKGAVVARGEPREVLTEANLRRIYGVDLRLIKVDDRVFIDF